MLVPTPHRAAAIHTAALCCPRTAACHWRAANPPPPTPAAPFLAPVACCPRLRVCVCVVLSPPDLPRPPPFPPGASARRAASRTGAAATRRRWRFGRRSRRPRRPLRTAWGPFACRRCARPTMRGCRRRRWRGGQGARRCRGYSRAGAGHDGRWGAPDGGGSRGRRAAARVAGAAAARGSMDRLARLCVAATTTARLTGAPTAAGAHPPVEPVGRGMAARYSGGVDEAGRLAGGGRMLRTRVAGCRGGCGDSCGAKLAERRWWNSSGRRHARVSQASPKINR